jgi:hypothetical protein
LYIFAKQTNQKRNKMTHLQKSINQVLSGIPVTRMPCVKSSFIRGLWVSDEEFAKLDPTKKCKKCQAIYNKKHNL